MIEIKSQQHYLHFALFNNWRNKDKQFPTISTASNNHSYHDRSANHVELFKFPAPQRPIHIVRNTNFCFVFFLFVFPAAKFNSIFRILIQNQNEKRGNNITNIEGTHACNAAQHSTDRSVDVFVVVVVQRYCLSLSAVNVLLVYSQICNPNGNDSTESRYILFIVCFRRSARP